MHGLVEGLNLNEQPYPLVRAGGDSVVTPDRHALRMKTQSPDRTGLLIVRLWIEGNTREGFRARITQTLDSAGVERNIATAGTPQAVCEVVQTWIDNFVNSN